jgi:hypothetical protein
MEQDNLTYLLKVSENQSKRNKEIEFMLSDLENENISFSKWHLGDVTYAHYEDYEFNSESMKKDILKDIDVEGLTKLGYKTYNLFLNCKLNQNINANNLNIITIKVNELKS